MTNEHKQLVEDALVDFVMRTLKESQLPENAKIIPEAVNALVNLARFQPFHPSSGMTSEEHERLTSSS
jgi:hypothetical protein